MRLEYLADDANDTSSTLNVPRGLYDNIVATPPLGGATVTRPQQQPATTMPPPMDNRNTFAPIMEQPKRPCRSCGRGDVNVNVNVATGTNSQSSTSSGSTSGPAPDQPSPSAEEIAKAVREASAFEAPKVEYRPFAVPTDRVVKQTVYQPIAVAWDRIKKIFVNRDVNHPQDRVKRVPVLDTGSAFEAPRAK